GRFDEGAGDRPLGREEVFACLCFACCCYLAGVVGSHTTPAEYLYSDYRLLLVALVCTYHELHRLLFSPMQEFALAL
ncbi:hypothetical protein BIW11_09357, partial [Tropilaelaps mercedesae]